MLVQIPLYTTISAQRNFIVKKICPIGISHLCKCHWLFFFSDISKWEMQLQYRLLVHWDFLQGMPSKGLEEMIAQSLGYPRDSHCTPKTLMGILRLLIDASSLNNTLVKNVFIHQFTIINYLLALDAISLFCLHIRGLYPNYRTVSYIYRQTK